MLAAERLVDDALPYNTVYVVNTKTNEQIGYAFFGGDGGSYFEKTPGKPNTYKRYVPPRDY